MPACDQTGTPCGLVGLTHLRSSTMSVSASWIRRRISASVSARQSPDDCADLSMRREAAFRVGRFDLAAAFAGLAVRDVRLALRLAIVGSFACDDPPAALTNLSHNRSQDAIQSLAPLFVKEKSPATR